MNVSVAEEPEPAGEGDVVPTAEVVRVAPAWLVCVVPAGDVLDVLAGLFDEELQA